MVLLYVLARKSVFGDEGVGGVGGISEHKYEVKAFDINGGLTQERPVETADLDPLRDVQEIDTNSGEVNDMGSESLGVDPLYQNNDNNNSIGDKTREGALEGASLQHSDQSQVNAGNLRGYEASKIDENNKLQSTDFETELKLHSTPNYTDLSEGTAVVPERTTNNLGNSVNDEEEDLELTGGVESPEGENEG